MKEGAGPAHAYADTYTYVYIPDIDTWMHACMKFWYLTNEIEARLVWLCND